MKVKLKDKVFNYRFAKKEDINRCLYLEKIIANESDSNLHLSYNKKDLIHKLVNKNKILLLFYKNRLIAYSNVELSNKDRLNWIDEFDIKKKFFCFVGYLGGTRVSSNFRGYGIQRFFIRKREEYLKKIGCKLSLITVHPKNKYSLNNIVSSNYILIKKNKNIFGKIRLFYKKSLN